MNPEVLKGPCPECGRLPDERGAREWWLIVVLLMIPWGGLIALMTLWRCYWP